MPHKNTTSPPNQSASLTVLQRRSNVISLAGFEELRRTRSNQEALAELEQQSQLQLELEDLARQISNITFRLNIPVDKLSRLVERSHFEAALTNSSGNVEEACRRLRITREYFNFVLQHRQHHLSNKLRQGEFSQIE